MSAEIKDDVARMANVDLVDVSAADFIDQVLYAKKLSSRFYADGGYPGDLSPIRIRGEITSNAGWMRRLCPIMSRITSSAKTPDDVVRMVSKWLDSTLVKIQPITWPLGEKFDQDPITTLICKRGNQMDAAILMIAALRASGVAARATPVYPDEFVSNSYTLAGYFDGIQWKSCYPKVGIVLKPRVLSEDLAKLTQWAGDIQQYSKLSLYVLVDDVWEPYSAGGRKDPATCSFDLAPGSYMASYEIGDICYMKRFVLRPSRQ